MDQFRSDGSINQQKDMPQNGNLQDNIQIIEMSVNSDQQGNIQCNETPNNGMQNNNMQNNNLQNNNMQNNSTQNNNLQNSIPSYHIPQNNVPNGMPPYNMPSYGSQPKRNVVQYNPEISDLNKLDIPPRKIVSWAGISLSILAAVVLGVQFLIELLVGRLKPELADTDWYIWAVTLLSLVIIGLPVYYLFISRIPDSPKGEVIKLKPSRFIAIFFICYCLMYCTNIFSTALVYIISLIKGDEVINPAAEAIYGGNYVITLLYAAVVAPIVEEIIFRKLLLNKLRRFGDVPAILLSGLAFGLFHFNLSQFFYAAVLGFVFAYVTIRTNTIRYSILLHMMVNGISTAISPLLLGGNMVVMSVILLCILTFVTLGAVFLIISIKKIKLEKPDPVMKASSYFLNVGAILYVVISIVIIIIQTFFA